MLPFLMVDGGSVIDRLVSYLYVLFPLSKEEMDVSQEVWAPQAWVAGNYAKVLHVIGEKVVERLTLSHFMIDSNFTSQF